MSQIETDRIATSQLRTDHQRVADLRTDHLGRLDVGRHDAPDARFGVPAVIAATVLVAVAINVVVWAIGALAGGSFEYTDGGTVQSAAPAGVILLTAVPLAVGLIVTALLARRWSVMIRVGQIVGSVAALGTIGGTIAADFDTASTISLSVAHATLVPALVVGLELVRRRQVRGARASAH